MNDNIKFKRNDLMGLKPALHPFDITMTPNYGGKNGKRVNFDGTMGNYPTERHFERSNTVLDDNSILPPARSKDVTAVFANKKYTPPTGYVPMFSAASTRPNTHIQGASMTNTSFRSKRRSSRNLRSAGNILNTQPSRGGGHPKWDTDNSDFDNFMAKPSITDELERLKGKLGTVNRYEDMMRDMRKISDKKFVMEMDQAIGTVKANRMPDEREMNKIFDKHLPPQKYPQASFSNVRSQPQVIVKKRRRNPTTMYSSESENEIEQLSENQIREIAQKRAQEILDKQMPKNLSEPLSSVNPFTPQAVQNNYNTENIVKLPNGMVMIKNNDPNIPPTLIMPQDQESEQETDNASDTEDIMNEYMDNIMQLKMMQAMQQNNPKKEKKKHDDALDYLQDEMDSKKPKKKKKKKRPKAPKSIPLDRNPPVSRLTTFQSEPEKEPSVKIEALEPEPEPPKLDVLPSALSKLWQIKTSFLYMKMRYELKNERNRKDYNQTKLYFDTDIPGIQEQTFYMLKTRMGLIVEDIIKDEGLNFDMTSGEQKNYVQLKDALVYILEELMHLSDLRVDENFDNPLVLSFMARFALPNCFLPDKFIFKFEADRIKFAKTGKTAFNLDPKVSKMLIGSYIIIKIFVDKMLLNAQEFFKGPGINFSQKAYDNLRVLSGCIYHMFKELFQVIQPIKNNMEVIELAPKPKLRFKHMFFNNDARGEPEEILSGVPPRSNYNLLFNDSQTMSNLKRVMIKIINNFYSQTLFQRDSEQMKQHQMRINTRKNVAKKLKRVMPDLAAKYEEYVMNKKKKLYLLEQIHQN